MVNNISTGNFLRSVAMVQGTAGTPASETADPVDRVDPQVVSTPAAPTVAAPAAPKQNAVASQVAGTLVAGPVGAAVSAVQQPTAIDPNNPQSGIRCGSFLRPDPLFSDKTQMVVHCARTGNNPSGVPEIPNGSYKMIETNQLLAGDGEVLIGFATPRVFTVLPRGNDAAGKPQAGYEKFDAFAFFKRGARMDSADAIRSGVFIRPRNLPADAITSLRTAMNEMLGDHTVSSAHANAEMLAAAGFTSGGKKISGKYFPRTLFMRIVEKGLEYKGQPVKFDIVSTTPLTLDEYFRKVIRKEISSPIDALTGKDAPDGTPPTAGPTSPPAPGPAGPPAPDAAPKVMIRNSRPGVAASMLRSLVGAHVMWEALPDASRVDVDQFLPDVLKDKFHDDKPLSRGEKIKKLLFTPAKVSFLRKCLAKTFDEAGAYSPDQLLSMLRIPGDEEEIPPDKDGLIKYNIVICGKNSERGNRIVIARLDVKNDSKIDDVLSKHVLISGYDTDVRFAGECWAERYTRPDGTQGTRFHISNNSGTYRPKDATVPAAAHYLEQVFPGIEIVPHAMAAAAAPKPAGKPDYIKDFPVAAAQVASLQSLDGKHVTLQDRSGHSKEYSIHKFKTVDFDMEFIDTPQRDLLKAGGILRARTQFKHGSDVKGIDVEAKMPTAGSAYQNRVKGESYRTAEAWQAARPEVLSPNTRDAAVNLARTAAGNVVPLDTVAWKKTSRELYFVTPTRPWLLGRLDPSFLVSVDTNAVRDKANGTPTASYTVLQPQIFTKLPWTKKITTQRVERFENLCDQMASEYKLSEAKETPYAEAVAHLAPTKP